MTSLHKVSVSIAVFSIGLFSKSTYDTYISKYGSSSKCAVLTKSGRLKGLFIRKFLSFFLDFLRPVSSSFLLLFRINHLTSEP